jgi:hypothetical protein
MSKLIRTNFDRAEHRRDRRYVLPPVTVTIAGHEYAVADWSLGGFQPMGEIAVVIGQQVDGTLSIAGKDAAYAFTAEVMRRDEVTNGFGFRFIEPSSSLIAALDRALMDRLSGKHR